MKKNSSRPVIIPNNEYSIKGGGSPVSIFMGIIGFVILLGFYLCHA